MCRHTRWLDERLYRTKCASYAPGKLPPQAIAYAAHQFIVEKLHLDGLCHAFSLTNALCVMFTNMK